MLNINEVLPKPKTVVTVIRPEKDKDADFIFFPQFCEKVIYFNEDRQEFRTGLYFGTWAQRNGSDEASPFLHECMPYCGSIENEVTRAFILDLQDGFSDYADIEIIGEATMCNIEWAHEQNRDLREMQAIERLAAFGTVEAVA